MGRYLALVANDRVEWLASEVARVRAYADDGSLNVFVESPRGATAKWKYENGIIRLSRPLPAGLAYPYDWGFIPGTRASDGDPLDALIVWEGISYPGVVVPSHPIGVLRVEQTSRTTQQRERNDRVIVVPISAAAIGLRSALEWTDRLREELEHFFTAAVAFEKKDPVLLGWGDAAESIAVINASLSSEEP
jgi:inorganic pyrophosphatase